MAIQQIVFLVALIFGGGYLGYWFRRFEMSGFELWFPMGLIISYAYGPLTGFAIAFSIMFITWMLFPYGLHHLAISAASFGVMFFVAVHFFPVTAENFLINGMIVALIFQGISNIFYFLTGYPWVRIIKFIITNLFFCFLIFSKFGWVLVQWLIA